VLLILAIKGTKMDRANELFKLAAERAREMQLPYAGAMTPREAYELLQLVANARLVDVRTKAEWDWVGRVPNSIEIEWFSYPGSVPNPGFVDQLKAGVATDAPVLFMCRSGVRSSNAARTAAEAGFVKAINVMEGFEGDKDGQGHRNSVNGWRASGLPWVQG
jgi:rhodanese-related sulfurtransferase